MRNTLLPLAVISWLMGRRQRYFRLRILYVFRQLSLLCSVIILMMEPVFISSQDQGMSFISKIDSILKSNDIPGAQMAIVSKDSIVWEANCGFANLVDSTKVNDQTFSQHALSTRSWIGLHCTDQ